MSSRPLELYVHGLSRRCSHGWLSAGARRLPVALGRSGRHPRKREGDGATPAGSWRVIEVFYRPDRALRPRSGLPIRRISPRDGWCDAPGDRNYNRRVQLPYPASAERLWRDDHLYDIVVVLDHNRRPRINCGGSAIFMHIARNGYQPTEGCIALSAKDLRLVVRQLGPGARIVVA
jgi:L,D-peptidoglycan transpeptidase YkuD (ErfK/YbiS/YcfS/YnhG family)